MDTDFLRCILDTSNNKWQVYDKCGNVYYFGQVAGSRVVNPKSSAGWGGYSATFHWALDQIVTATGDLTTIAYATAISPYTGLPEQTIYPTNITYNGHTSYNGYGASYTGTHTISFGTEARPDWRFSYRWGFRTEQSRRLTNIVCQVNGQKVWHYALSYGTSPATERSLLKSVTVFGSNDSTPLPVQTFTYQGNTNKVSFGPPIQWGALRRLNRVRKPSSPNNKPMGRRLLISLTLTGMDCPIGWFMIHRLRRTNLRCKEIWE